MAIAHSVWAIALGMSCGRVIETHCASQVFSGHQPITPIIESVRGLLNGTPVGNAPWLAIAWCTGILALSVALSGMAFSRRTR